jgi:hypothetical protein
MDWPERFAAMAACAATITLIFFGGVLSALAFLVCGFMGWTRVFEDVRAQGKPTPDGRGRILIAAVCVVLGVICFPQADEVEQSPKKVDVPRFGKMEAIEACKEGVAARARHPSTVEFPALDYEFRDYNTGKSDLLMSAKARNGFNLLVSFDVECNFTNGRIDRVLMSEAGPSS